MIRKLNATGIKFVLPFRGPGAQRLVHLTIFLESVISFYCTASDSREVAIGTMMYLPRDPHISVAAEVSAALQAICTYKVTHMPGRFDAC